MYAVLLICGHERLAQNYTRLRTIGHAYQEIRQMKYSRNSLLLTAGLFSMAAAIVFNAWWPSYKADRDLEKYVADCMPVDLLADKRPENAPKFEAPEQLKQEQDRTSQRRYEIAERKARNRCIKEYYVIHSSKL